MLLGAWAAEPPTEAPSEELRVGTANVWGLPWPLTPHRRGRLKRTLAWLEQGDFAFVGLQEAWLGARRHLVHPHIHFPQEVDSGLALYTPHELVQPLQLVAFTAGYGVDRLKRKGVAVGRVRLPGVGEVTVAVAHLQAGASTEAAMVRQVQVHQLLEALPEGPCVLVGDLNVHRDDPLDAESLLSLAEAGFVELVPEHRDKGTSRYGAHRFDRLFVRDGPVVHWQPQRARVLRDEDWSDHFPVTARLRRKRPR